MSNWTFKAVVPNPSGQATFVDLSPDQLQRTEIYKKALRVAASSDVAKPPFSNYFVREGIGAVEDEAMIPAGNIEYGLCKALHGEEAAVAAYRATYGRKTENQVVLGIVAGTAGNIANPCGNCRDIMLEDLGTDFEIVCGAPEGGTAVVASMQHYIFGDFTKLPSDTLSGQMRHWIRLARKEGERLTNDAYSPPAVHPERRYHALIKTDRSMIVGARDIMCEYHPIYALRDAIRQARRTNDVIVQMVVVVCEDYGGGPPHVMYKDRQHLLELNLQAELLTGQKQNPTVLLATCQGEEITGIWATSVKEWLPFPFSPRNFGDEFITHLTGYYKARYEKRRQ